MLTVIRYLGDVLFVRRLRRFSQIKNEIICGNRRNLRIQNANLQRDKGAVSVAGLTGWQHAPSGPGFLAALEMTPNVNTTWRLDIPEPGRKLMRLNAGIAQLVEHNLAKVGVASSSLVSRSSYLTALAAVGRAFTGGGLLWMARRSNQASPVIWCFPPRCFSTETR